MDTGMLTAVLQYIIQTRMCMRMSVGEGYWSTTPTECCTSKVQADAIATLSRCRRTRYPARYPRQHVDIIHGKMQSLQQRHLPTVRPKIQVPCRNVRHAADSLALSGTSPDITPNRRKFSVACNSLPAAGHGRGLRGEVTRRRIRVLQLQHFDDLLHVPAVCLSSYKAPIQGRNWWMSSSTRIQGQ